MRSASFNSLALVGMLLLGACARPAGTLPPDYGSVNAAQQLDAAQFSQSDQAMTCGEISEERARIAETNRQAEAVIASDRTQNQVAGYFAALFLVPIVAVDSNEEQVALLNRNQARQDQLIRLSRLRGC
ncbi:MAG: hypothetical protein AAGH68_06665 [Pseudomonadota bacterium]